MQCVPPRAIAVLQSIAFFTGVVTQPSNNYTVHQYFQMRPTCLALVSLEQVHPIFQTEHVFLISIQLILAFFQLIVIAV